MKLTGLKGQSALEYMVNYGWMLLVVGLVALVLWQFGAFNPQNAPPGCTGFSQISPTDWKVDSADPANLITLTLLNNAGTKIALTRVNVTFYNQMCHVDLNQDLRAGQSFQVTVPNSCNMALPLQGEYFKADMTFYYTNIESGITHASAGECHGTTE
jgi:hypothetical protein